MEEGLKGLPHAALPNACTQRRCMVKRGVCRPSHACTHTCCCCGRRQRGLAVAAWVGAAGAMAGAEEAEPTQLPAQTPPTASSTAALRQMTPPSSKRREALRQPHYGAYPLLPGPL